MKKHPFFLLVICFIVSSCGNPATVKNEKAVNDTPRVDSAKTISNAKPSSLKENYNKDSYPFDTILYNCMHVKGGHGGTTVGMIDCFTNSAVKLNTLVDQMYRKLYLKLDKEDRPKLKLSQDRWRKFYAAEGDFLFSAFYTWANVRKYGHGRGHAISQAEWHYKVVRQRLIALTEYDSEIYEGF